MPEPTATIAGYKVEVVTLDDDRRECYVSKDRYSASLTALADTGELLDGYGDAYPVPARAIELIEKWAYKNGY